MALAPLAASAPDGSRAQLINRFLDLQPRLRRRFSRGVPARLRAEIGSVTVQQMTALHAIARAESVTMSTLASSLQAASLSSATQMADRLVRLGLVERVSDPEDRRVVRLTLSDRGRGLFEGMDTAWRQGIAEALEGLSDRECRDLVMLLEKVAGPPPVEEMTPWASTPKS